MKLRTMPGDYKQAMSRMCVGFKPPVWTPLHCLLHGSDTMLIKRKVVKCLLGNKIVSIDMFDALENWQVIVFLTRIGLISTGTTGGLEGSLHAGWKAMSQNDPQLYASFHGQRSPG